MIQSCVVTIGLTLKLDLYGLNRDVKLIVADMTPGSPVAIEAFTADMKVWKSGRDESGHCFGIRGRNVGMFEFDHVGSAMLFLFSFLLYFFLFL